MDRSYKVPSPRRDFDIARDVGRDDTPWYTKCDREIRSSRDELESDSESDKIHLTTGANESELEAC